MFLYSLLLLAECWRQYFNQLYQDVGFSFGGSIEGSTAEMLNKHPVLNFFSNQVKKIDGKFSYFWFMRGKAAEDFIWKHAEIGLY